MTIEYLALGDSLTIGEQVQTPESLPQQITQCLSEHLTPIVNVHLLAQTGWTSAELLTQMQKQSPTKKFSLITLLIGTNDHYRGYNIGTYQHNLVRIIKTAWKIMQMNSGLLYVLSLPDWSNTPGGSSIEHLQYRASKYPQTANDTVNTISNTLDNYNLALQQTTDYCKTQYSIPVNWIDITGCSRQYPHLVIPSDQLHPSATMYQKWACITAADILKHLSASTIKER